MKRGPRYEAIDKRMWGLRECKPLVPSAVSAVVVQHSDNGSPTIADFASEGDAQIFVDALRGKEERRREKPQLTSTHMKQKEFEDKLVAFLNTIDGQSLRTRLKKLLCSSTS